MAKIKSLLKINGNDNYVYATLNGIDTSNILFESGTLYQTTITYTATEDCFIEFYGSGNIEVVKIDDVSITSGNQNAPMYMQTFIPLVKGQTIIAKSATNYNSKIIAYGIKR